MVSAQLLASDRLQRGDSGPRRWLTRGRYKYPGARLALLEPLGFAFTAGKPEALSGASWAGAQHVAPGKGRLPAQRGSLENPSPLRGMRLGLALGLRVER